jgi:hypothetical protein
MTAAARRDVKSATLRYVNDSESRSSNSRMPMWQHETRMGVGFFGLGMGLCSTSGTSYQHQKEKHYVFVLDEPRLYASTISTVAVYVLQ